MIHLRELYTGDLGAVVHLESQTRPSSQCLGKGHFRSLLEFVQKQGWGINLGLFDGRRLVGYLMGRKAEDPAESTVEASGSLHASEFAVLPEFRAYAPRLFTAALHEMSILFPGQTLVVPLSSERYGRWSRHAGYFSRLGFACESGKPGRLPDGSVLSQWSPMQSQAETGKANCAPRPLFTRMMTLDGHPYQLRVWTRVRDWSCLEPDWNRLVADTEESTVFQSYEYQRIWWRHFGLGKKLNLVSLHDGNQVIGIAPLQISIEYYFGAASRELGYIGVNWEVDRPKMLFGKHPDVCARLLADYLHANRSAWDLCRFYEQPEQSVAVDVLRDAMSRSGYLTGETKDSVAPFLRTDGPWKAYHDELSKKLRRNMRSARNRLEKMGRFEYRDYRTFPEVRDRLSWYKAIEQKSWKAGASVGPSRSYQYSRFFDDMVESFGRRGLFHLRFIVLDEQPIAGTFGLEYNDYFYSLHITHDQEYDKYSVGTLLEYLELEDCFDSNIVEYDFLGSFLNNKLRWTSTLRGSRELHVYRKRWQTILLFILYLRIKPLIKRVVKGVIREDVMAKLVAYKVKYEHARNRRAE